MINNNLKELLSNLKKFKVRTVLVLDFKKRNDCKIFHLSTKLIATDSGIDLMHASKQYDKNKKLCS